MTKLLLIYPFFPPRHDRSVFRFPPLGVAYVASFLRERGHDVTVLDCTFLSRRQAFARARACRAEVVGIYCMVTMRQDCIALARHLRGDAKLLVAGGPMPTADPAAFLSHFDVVVRGEGERTMAELLTAYERRADLGEVPGLVLRDAGAPGAVRATAARPLEPDLDRLPIPARELLPIVDYIRHGRGKYGYSITSIMTTRGCPFSCEFCSNVVFGVSHRLRSVENVLAEVEQVIALGFERVHFADDVLTLDRKRLLGLCRDIGTRGLRFKWECLARADTIDLESAAAMRAAGCEKIYFGLESGDDRVLALMNKRTTALRARQGVEAAAAAGIKTGAFFILFYPGDTDETVLGTIRYALSLPLDYLSFTVPYPIPGTGLCERMQGRRIRPWRQTGGLLSSHEIIYDGDFSAAKMKLGIVSGTLEFMARKHLGPWAARALAKPVELAWRWLP